MTAFARTRKRRKRIAHSLRWQTASFLIRSSRLAIAWLLWNRSD